MASIAIRAAAARSAYYQVRGTRAPPPRTPSSSPLPDSPTQQEASPASERSARRAYTTTSGDQVMGNSTSASPGENMPPRRLLVIPAVNSSIAQGIIPSALQKGYQVLGLTGSPTSAMRTYGNHVPNLRFAAINHADYQDPDAVSDVVAKSLGIETFDEVAVVNVLGGTNSAAGAPDSSEMLYERNVRQPAGVVSGILAGVKDRAGAASVAHISSIAASISDPSSCGYARVRLEGERTIAERSSDHPFVKSVTQLRVGLVQPRMKFDRKTGQYVLDSGHKHSAETWSKSRMIFVAGEDKNPVHQPVGLDCVANAVVAATKRDFGDYNHVVDCVSKQTMTQREYLSYFSKHRQILCVHLPPDLLYSTTQIASEGRMQPYAINIIKALEENPNLLDGEDLEKLLGKPALTLDEIYGDFRDQHFIHKGPELHRYALEFAKSGVRNPGLVLELLKTAGTARGWGLSVIEKTKE